MDGAEQGFLIVYEFEDDDRPLIIEDDGQAWFSSVVTHSMLRSPSGRLSMPSQHNHFMPQLLVFLSYGAAFAAR